VIAGVLIVTMVDESIRVERYTAEWQEDIDRLKRGNYLKPHETEWTDAEKKEYISTRTEGIKSAKQWNYISFSIGIFISLLLSALLFRKIRKLEKEK
jgi:hypothetical protein